MVPVRLDEHPARDLRLAGALARIHAVAFAGEGRPWSAPEILALLSEPGVGLRLAHAGQGGAGDRLAPAGFALYRVAADEAELLTVAVAPQAWRAGLGRALLGACEDGARAAGARRLFLEVGAANGAARVLYAGAGYREVGRRPGYYRRPDGRSDDALVLAKAL
ncbi:MAG TPA: GNAT family N-acetyltransferase [Thermohalobaculum sp.]|nr:GNAT family N-acetyltransferase [Thermohalobaculum sp.]